MPTPFQLRLKTIRTTASPEIEKPSILEPLTKVTHEDLDKAFSTEEPEPKPVEAESLGTMKMTLLVDSTDGDDDPDFQDVDLRLPPGVSDPRSPGVDLPMTTVDREVYGNPFNKIVDSIDPDSDEDDDPEDDMSLDHGADLSDMDDDDDLDDEENEDAKFFDLLSSFLSVNPEPSDEQFHCLAASIGMEHEHFEARVFALLGMMLENEEISDETRILINSRFNK